MCICWAVLHFPAWLGLAWAAACPATSSSFSGTGAGAGAVAVAERAPPPCIYGPNVAFVQFLMSFCCSATQFGKVLPGLGPRVHWVQLMPLDWLDDRLSGSAWLGRLADLTAALEALEKLISAGKTFSWPAFGILRLLFLALLAKRLYNIIKIVASNLSAFNEERPRSWELVPGFSRLAFPCFPQNFARRGEDIFGLVTYLAHFLSVHFCVGH